MSNVKRVMRSVCFALLLVCMAALCGCWDNAEINGRAFVLGFGMDDGGKEGVYDFTFQLAVPVSGASDSSGAIEYLNCTVREESAAAAVRLLEKNIGRQINFEQLNAIIIGETLAHERFTGLTEFFFRRASVRRQSSIAVCGGSAKAFLAAEATGRSIASDASIALQSYDDRGGADAVAMNLHSLFKMLSNEDEFYLLRITAVNPDTVKDGGKADMSANGDGRHMLCITGAAAYGRSGEYRGELNGRELELLRLISGHQISGVVSGSDAASGRTVYYQIRQSRCDVKCRLQDGIPHFTADLYVMCTAADIGDLYGSGETENAISAAEQTIASALQREMTALAWRSKSELGASVLGLQDQLRQNMPDWYEKNADRWEALYAKARIDIDVKCTVSGGGVTR